MDQIVQRIRPKDYELSTVQDNLANALEKLSTDLNNSIKALQNPASGYKTKLSVGSVWNSNYTANALTGTGITIQNQSNGAIGITPFIDKFTHSGSIVGLSMNQSGPITGMNVLYIYKNNNLVYTWNAGTGGNNAAFWSALSKGTLSFAAGDTLTCNYSNSASGNTQMIAHLTIEMAP